MDVVKHYKMQKAYRVILDDHLIFIQLIKKIGLINLRFFKKLSILHLQESLYNKFLILSHNKYKIITVLLGIDLFDCSNLLSCQENTNFIHEKIEEMWI